MSNSKLSRTVSSAATPEIPKNPKKLLQASVTGAILVALCCFTPILVIIMATVGLSALTGYLDYLLLPALAAFIGLTLYALWRKKRYNACCNLASNEPGSSQNE